MLIQYYQCWTLGSARLQIYYDLSAQHLVDLFYNLITVLGLTKYPVDWEEPLANIPTIT
jgi:hypothetical protein